MTRIVAGLAKGRRLDVPDAGTRPTSDRVREALFSSVEATIRLDGARVLDLYAGTGALGLEALSRGAAAVTLVENSRRALPVLRRNVDAVGLPGARVVGSAVSAFLRVEPDEQYDLVLADPPYSTTSTEVFELLRTLPGWTAPDATVVIERSAREGSPDWAAAGITPAGEKRYGDTLLWYGRRS